MSAPPLPRLLLIGLVTSLAAASSCSRDEGTEAGADPSSFPNEFLVTNNCEFPLWIEGVNNPLDASLRYDLTPHRHQLAPGDSLTYAVPADWPSGRVNAYWADPEQNPNAFDKVEMTVEDGVMNYNITYVDYVALPSSAEAVGDDCSDARVGCFQTRQQLLDSCPDALSDGERCLSAKEYCAIAANSGDDYCHVFDDVITQCATDNPDTCGVAMTLGNGTQDVYACTGYFDSQPNDGCSPASETCHFEGNKWCAAINRGMLDDPDGRDASQYYQNEPFNTYAQWVHEVCPGIYAFPYDDYPTDAEQSGFRSCTSDRLEITFCPAG
ncbi:MAG: beta-1,3-glucanase family protein [Myxococcota bacterium]